MNFFNKLSLAVVLIAFAAFGAFAQNGTSARADLPFVAGETLSYEGKISKSIVRGIAVADMTFTLERPKPDGDFVVKAEARSKGTLSKLVRFSFLQQIESVFGGREGRIKLTKKHDVQKERVRDSEAFFDYDERQVTFTEVNPKEPMRPPRRIASDIAAETHDMISAIYKLRTLPMAIGTSYRMIVSDSGLVYTVPVKITARERQKTAIGTVWCWRVEPDVFGPGRFIEREGSMIIWITDDARRIPVRSQVNSSIGGIERIEIKIKSAKNTKA